MATVRRARDDDWPAIWSIWHAIVAEGETYAWSPTTSEHDARAAWMLAPPAEAFVLEDDAVRATAVLKPNAPGLGDHVANASFMVDPSARGNGYGRQLAEFVIARAKEAGFHAMQFNAVVSTNDGAIKLWESLGFEIVGRIPSGFRHARAGLVDLLIMYRAL